MALCSEMAMTDAEKESEARCTAMLSQLISAVKKQTLEMEDLAVRMNKLAIDLKAIVLPRGVPDLVLLPSATAPTATLAAAVDRAVAAATPSADAALDPESPTRCSMIGSGDDTASQTSAFVSDAAPGSPSTTALLDVAITSPEQIVATIRVHDGLNDLAAHQLLGEMPPLAKVDSTAWLRPSVSADADARSGHVTSISVDRDDELTCAHVLCRSDDCKVLWAPPMKWAERRFGLPPAHTEITGDSVELHQQSWRSCYQGEVQRVPPWPPPQGPGMVLKLFHKQAVSRILENVEQGSESCDDLDHLALVGIGPALTCADELQFTRILGSLIRICRRIGNLGIGVRVLKLVEWLVLGFVESRKMRKVQVLFEIISPEKCESEDYVLFPVVMVACGALRALRVASVRYRLDFDPRLKEMPEQTIQFAAEKAVLEGRHVDDRRILLQCVALGLTRCGQVAFHESVLQCVCMALLKELLPLPDLLRMSVQSPDGNSAEVVKTRVKQHQDSVLFKEAGPVTGVLCNQYSFANEKAKTFVETCVWGYAQELYCNLRAAVLLHRGKWDDLLVEIEKIAEASFLMVVVFAAEVTKHRLNTKSSEGFQPEVAVRILVAFSCVEHLRHLRLPEYTEAVRRAVLVNQENAAASALFIESMPSYAELTSKPDLLTLDGTRYIWYRDEVQTSRILFYLRVLPTCISLIPAQIIRDKLASIMFLYIQHSNEKVTRASHSVMVSFLSSGNDTDQDDRMALKEQLAFYYIERSLEAYPGVTPFEGLASGVAALIRHLPAGSPAILFCIHSLTVKAKDLCNTSKFLDKSLWRSWEDSTEPCKKILDLLLRLIFLVDIQAFPYLLKELAEFVTLLPKEGQDVLLDDMHAHVAESDDVTRKPVLVPWLQSLSYISSQATHRESHNKDANACSVGSDELSMNRTMARM